MQPLYNYYTLLIKNIFFRVTPSQPSVYCNTLPNSLSPPTNKVNSVADGDTITILDSSKKQHKIRFYGIDCTERGQPFGKAAKKHTSRLTYKKATTVTVYDTDKYGRTVGIVKVAGVNVNEELIRAGFAWQYRKYCKALLCDNWLQVEKKAKKSKVGLWKVSDPVPPWQWRKGTRNSSYIYKRSSLQFSDTLPNRCSGNNLLFDCVLKIQQKG